MKTKEIKKNNILLATFLEWELFEGFSYKTPFQNYYLSTGAGIQQTNIFHEDELKFHESWDWIICVAEKCKDIFLEKDNFSVTNDWESVESGLLSLDIRHVYAAVLEFINNKNKK